MPRITISTLPLTGDLAPRALMRTRRGLRVGPRASALILALRFGAGFARQVHRQCRRHEGIEGAIQNALRVRGFLAGAQILHHLVGVQHIGPDLVAPAGIALGVVLGLYALGALAQFHFVKTRFQRGHRVGAVLVLRFFGTGHDDAGRQVGDPHRRLQDQRP